MPRPAEKTTREPRRAPTVAAQDSPTHWESTAPQDVGLIGAASFDVYRRLRSDILECRLMPGEKLGFQLLKDRYGAGVGTLREALSHLVGEGFVRTEAGHGFRVAPVSVGDLLDIVELRVDFETRALSDSIQRGDEQWEVEIISAFHLMSKVDPGATPQDGPAWSDWSLRHQRFHAALVAACGSPWLLHFRAVLFDQASRYRRLAFLHHTRPRNKVDEHRSMMDAVLSRDVAKACDLTERHIRETVDTVLRRVPGMAVIGAARVHAPAPAPAPAPARARRA